MKTSERIFITVFCSGLFVMTFWRLEPALFGMQGANNMQALRSGQAIQINKDVSGRLNLQNKTLELSTGQVLDASGNSDLFPSSKAELKSIEEKESFMRNHPITYEIQKFYNENGSSVWLICGFLITVYAGWRLLKFLIRELLFTATKAIEDAKSKKE